MSKHVFEVGDTAYRAYENAVETATVIKVRKDGCVVLDRRSLAWGCCTIVKAALLSPTPAQAYWTAAEELASKIDTAERRLAQLKHRRHELVSVAIAAEASR